MDGYGQLLIAGIAFVAVLGGVGSVLVLTTWDLRSTMIRLTRDRPDGCFHAGYATPGFRDALVKCFDANTDSWRAATVIGATFVLEADADGIAIVPTRRDSSWVSRIERRRIESVDVAGVPITSGVVPAISVKVGGAGGAEQLDFIVIRPRWRGLTYTRIVDVQRVAAEIRKQVDVPSR